MVKIELGGGLRPKGPPFVNVDLNPGMEGRQANLEKEPIPFPDDSADEMYSAHFLEHIHNQAHVLREIVRVCVMGAKVEIRVPHYLSTMAMCAGHRCVISPQQVKHWTDDFPQAFFQDMPKRLRLVRTEQVPGEYFAEAKRLHPRWTDDQVMRFVPGAAHEIQYHLEVIANEP